MKKLTEQDFIDLAYKIAGYGDLLHSDTSRNMTEDEFIKYAKEAFVEYKKALDEIKRLKDLAEQVLYDFAWYKDGTLLVGCGIKTYKQAQKELLEKLDS